MSVEILVRLFAMGVLFPIGLVLIFAGLRLRRLSREIRQEDSEQDKAFVWSTTK